MPPSSGCLPLAAQSGNECAVHPRGADGVSGCPSARRRLRHSDVLPATYVPYAPHRAPPVLKVTLRTPCPHPDGGAIQGVALNLAGTVTTLAGTAGTVASTNGTGLAAYFYHPYGIPTDGMNLYVANPHNQTIRQVVLATGAVTARAGTVGTVGSANGSGSAAPFHYPNGITTDGTHLYVAVTYNNTVRALQQMPSPRLALFRDTRNGSVRFWERSQGNTYAAA